MTRERRSTSDLLKLKSVSRGGQRETSAEQNARLDKNKMSKRASRARKRKAQQDVAVRETSTSQSQKRSRQAVPANGVLESAEIEAARGRLARIADTRDRNQCTQM